MSVPAPDPAADAARLAAVREETRDELGLLHERVNALLGAEAFLTIAYTAAMSNGAPWGRRLRRRRGTGAGRARAAARAADPARGPRGRTHPPGLSAQQDELFGRLGGTAPGYHGGAGRPSSWADQRRALLFFRAVPVLFTVVWIALGVLALVLVP